MCFVPGHLVSCLFGWSIIITIEILRSSGKYMKFQASLIINPFSYSVLAAAPVVVLDFST